MVALLWNLIIKTSILIFFRGLSWLGGLFCLPVVRYGRYPIVLFLSYKKTCLLAEAGLAYKWVCKVLIRA